MAPRLLVVDPGTRQVLRPCLANAGFRSEETSVLDGALAWLAGSSPAAVVLHDGIGGTLGVEVVQSRRAQHPGLPVVFIAQGGEHPRAAGASLAATACVDTSLGIDDLLAAVVRAIPGTGPLR